MSFPEALKPIAWLSGRWATKDGHGMYPNLPTFQFHHVLEFECIGQPMLNFSSISKHPDDQTPTHQERGFLHINPGTTNIALLVSHNFGLISIEEGHFDEEINEIVLETVTLARISFAKDPIVKKIKRVIKSLSPQKIQVELLMATHDTPMSAHLKAIYTKLED